MNEFISQAKELFTGGITVPAIATVIAVWVLGKLSGSKWYRATRAIIGKACHGAGVFVDSTLGSKFGRQIWNPLEKVFTDFLGFAVEQFCTGLRANDVDAMASQVERLEDVGSKNRIQAIKQAMEKAVAEKLAEG